MVKTPKLIALLIYLTCWPAAVLSGDPAKRQPDRVYRASNDVVVHRLKDLPCTDPKILAMIAEWQRPNMREAILTWEGRDWPSCWVKIDDRVYSIDTEGDRFSEDREHQGMPWAFYRDESI